MAALGAVVAVALVLVLVAVPVIDTVQSTETVVREHALGVETPVTGDLLGTLEAVHAADNATVTLQDNRTLQTATLTIDNGTSAGLTLAGISMTLTVQNASQSAAVVAYELPTTAYIDDIAGQMIVPLMTLVVVLLVALALAAVRGSI